VLSIIVPFAGTLLAAEFLVYLSTMILVGFHAALRRGKAFLIPGLPLGIFAMHIAWGSGFLWSILTLGVQKHG
jgi:hypothetical protein